MQPWSVIVEGEVSKPRSFGIEDPLQLPHEERVYRLRCVEAWSMVIPWIGFEFRQLARLVEPTSKAKFVEFITATQSESMLGLRSSVLPWPYTEGLRIDERQPLTTWERSVPGEYGFYSNVNPNVDHVRWAQFSPCCLAAALRPESSSDGAFNTRFQAPRIHHVSVRKGSDPPLKTDGTPYNERLSEMCRSWCPSFDPLRHS